MRTLLLLLVVLLNTFVHGQKKAVFIILDGISADILEKIETPNIDAISKAGGYARAFTGGIKDSNSQSPTISAVGYNHVLTGVWTNKHNVWNNDIAAPNYHYPTIFKIAKDHNPTIKTALFSTWLDNRTKLIGENLPATNHIKVDYAFDGFELDEKTFPHDEGRTYIQKIDNHVAAEAARYIKAEAPDLSWMYLEFTDDMGHRYGDGSQYFDAIRIADKQVGLIWESIKFRQKNFKEDWLIVVTTDHGRDAATGKNHGGQSERERTVWVSTNAKKLNAHFKGNLAHVDIMPAIARHLGIPLPEQVAFECDGVPFIGNVEAEQLRAVVGEGEVVLVWNPLVASKSNAEIFFSTTDNFNSGGTDVYQKLGVAKITSGKFVSPLPNHNGFIKFLVKLPSHSLNVAYVEKK